MSDPNQTPDDGRWVLFVVPGLFALLGGAMGGLAMWLTGLVAFVLAPLTGGDVGGGLGALLVALLIFPVFGAVVGFPSALATGLMATVLIRRRPRAIAFVLACAALGGLSATLQAAIFAGWSLPVMAYAGAAAGGVCGFLTLRLLSNQPTVQPRAKPLD